MAFKNNKTPAVNTVPIFVRLARYFPISLKRNLKSISINLKTKALEAIALRRDSS